MVAPILVECYVMASLAFHRMAMGYLLAFPAAFTAGVTANSTGDLHATKNEASWIVASFSVTGAISYFILPPVMQIFGRRFSNVLNNVIPIVGAIVIALAPNITILVLGQCIQGLGFCGLLLNCLMAAEYTQPKRRAFFVVFIGVATCLGVLLCHSLSFILTWRHIAWLGVLFPTISALSTIMWPESPYWLALKGRYDDCSKEFKILRGNDLESKKELRHLIAVQREINKNKKVDENEVTRTINAFRSKEFWKPLGLLILLEILAQVSGTFYLLAYIIQIMQQLSGDETKTFYYTVAVDIIKVVAVFMSSLIFKVVNVRSLLFSAGSLACFLLSLICIFDYLEYADILGMRWVTPSIMIVYTFLCQIGITPVYILVSSEIIPLKYKSLGSCTIGIIYCLLGFITLKFTSTMLEMWGVRGTFGVYLVIAVACLILLYFYLPETKGRTLQEIEMDFVVIKLNEENADQETLFNPPKMKVEF